MKRILTILFATIILVSCKKDPKTISISGTVTDPYQNIPVAGAKVTLQANGVVEGVYNSSYITLGIATTDAAGQFEFIVDESAYDSFRFSFLKDGYYSMQKVVTAGSISPEAPYDGDFDFPSEATVNVHIQNATPFDTNDKLIAYFENNPISSFDCCSSTPVTYQGMSIDTTFYCKSVGGFDLILFKSLLKNNVQTYETVIVHTLPGDTVNLEVLY